MYTGYGLGYYMERANLFLKINLKHISLIWRNGFVDHKYAEEIMIFYLKCLLVLLQTF